MNTIKFIVKQPLKHALAASIISLLFVMALNIISLALSRVDGGPFRTLDQGYVVFLARIITAEAVLIARLVFHLSCLVLIGQLVYRIAQKRQ